MVDVPHLFVAASVEIDGCKAHGVSSDGLAPKWFTKDPETSYEQDDLPAMLSAIRQAALSAVGIGRQRSFFAWWRQLYEAQQAWAEQNRIAHLLSGFGTSLVERAVLDAFARHLQLPLFQLLRDNVLAIELGTARRSLGSMQPRDALATRPADRVRLRHTIGLGDPLSRSGAAEIADPEDGLPWTLEENIRAYGLNHFKIKLSGTSELDRERLTEILGVIESAAVKEPRFTLDGNENYGNIAQLREAWEELRRIEPLKEFFDRALLFVEQPLHRSCALDLSVKEELSSWPDAPAMIIDESDADLSCLPTALSLGYCGTSHKNCKGIMKGLLAAATIKCESTAQRPLILSAEDLVNVGPVALLQDLAMVAALGISHAERNGHHYFAGLSMFPQRVQNQMVEHHADLYHRKSDGLVALHACDGMLSLESINRAPFGTIPLIDLSQFAEWS